MKNAASDDVGFTANVWVTGVAGEKLELPGWLAVIEQVPADTRVTVFPATVHTGAVFEPNTTVRPELAVALIANGAAPSVALFKGLNVIV